MAGPIRPAEPLGSPDPTGAAGLTADSMVIHRVTEDDWRSHKEIRLEMLREEPGAFTTTLQDVVDRTDAQWRAATATGAFFQARCGERVIGSAGLLDGAGPDDRRLVALYTRPAARGSGAGEALVRAAVEEARRQGAAHVTLHVVRSNAPAIRLYSRMGFTRTGAVADDPADPCGGQDEMRIALDVFP